MTKSQFILTLSVISCNENSVGKKKKTKLFIYSSIYLRKLNYTYFHFVHQIMYCSRTDSIIIDPRLRSTLSIFNLIYICIINIY